MKARTLLASIIVALGLAAPAGAAPGICQISGAFTLNPGLTGAPASGPVQLSFSGKLTGPGCMTHTNQTLTGNGELMAGSSCTASVGDGTVSGVPGVNAFITVAVGPKPEVVLQNGSAPAGYMTVEFLSNGPGVAAQCAGAGIKGGVFTGAAVFAP